MTAQVRSTPSEGGDPVDGRPLRALFLIDTLEVGGTETSLLNIIRHARGIAGTVCHLYPGATLRPAFEDAGATVIGLDIQAKYGVPTAVVRLLPIIATIECDVICGLLARSGIVARILGRMTGIPVIGSFVSDSYTLARRSTMTWSRALKLWAWQGLDRLTVPWTAHFIANSRAVAESNRSALRIPRSAVSVIYRGRDVSEFPAPPPRQGGRRPTLLNVGRLVPAKGQAQLLDAMLLLRPWLPTLQLQIAGEGPLRASLAERARTLGVNGNVELLGNRGDVPALLAGADVFVFSSHHEGHPGALIEAMLAGLPVVASDIPVHRETIAEGQTGLLFPLNDASRLAELIRHLFERPEERVRLGRNARSTAMRRFDIQRIARQHESVYRRLATNRRAPRVSSATVARLLHAHEVDWVFVDFFETLVHRSVSPHAVKQLAARRLISHLGLTIDPELFLESRLRIERRLREQGLALSETDELRLADVSADLLVELRRAADLPLDWTRLSLALVEAETAAELSVQHLRADIADMVRSWSRLGARVALLVDYHLPEVQVRAMLRHHGIEDLFGAVLVSCDARASKLAGSLYDHALLRLATTGDRAVMVGVDRHADGDMAQSRGLRTVLVKAAD